MNSLLTLIFLLFLFIFLIWNMRRKQLKGLDKKRDLFPIEKKKQSKKVFSDDELSLQKSMLNQSQSEFEDRLTKTSETFPFKKWYNDLNLHSGMEQYTQEVCEQGETIFKALINALIKLGIKQKEADKILLFQTAIEALNQLNAENDYEIIETGEREELCELTDTIAQICGIIPSKYGDGDGVASEWRDW